MVLFITLMKCLSILFNNNCSHTVIWEAANRKRHKSIARLSWLSILQNHFCNLAFNQTKQLLVEALLQDPIELFLLFQTPINVCLALAKNAYEFSNILFACLLAIYYISTSTCNLYSLCIFSYSCAWLRPLSISAHTKSLL